MHLQPDAVAKPVTELRAIARIFNHLSSTAVDVVSRDARPHHRNRRLLSTQHYVEDLRELRCHGSLWLRLWHEHARQITLVERATGTPVNQHEFRIADALLRRWRMWQGRAGADSHDAWEARATCADVTHAVLHQIREILLRIVRPELCTKGLEGALSEFYRLANRCQFRLILDCPQRLNPVSNGLPRRRPSLRPQRFHVVQSQMAAFTSRSEEHTSEL